MPQLVRILVALVPLRLTFLLMKKAAGKCPCRPFEYMLEIDLKVHIYNTFYSRSGYEGVGQAKAVVFFIVVAIIALLQLKITREKEVES